MRLESIVLHGFKSFAEKTELKILPGITAIVGPNGTGKSNISEAIRWALGEQSPKSLRGSRMEDVIFHGSASRKPVGLAQVSLVFSNDGTLSVPWTEVQVSRRLYRTGESEYLLNQTLCRLRDILDLFVGTGANPKAYALMDQERLNQVLTARPVDRRVLIEEAAGISRYKQQRAETLGKLEATRLNLLRVKDVMDEVRRQLGSLERQARRARQYKALHQEKQALALTLVAAEHAGFLAEEQVLASESGRLRQEQGSISVNLSRLAARTAEKRAQIQEAEHRLGDLRQTVQKIQVEMERLLERREQLGLQIRELANEDVRAAEEIRLINERRRSLAAELEDKARILAESQEAHRRLGQDVATREAQLAEMRSELRVGRERREALRLDQVRAAGERAELTRAIGELREREHQLGKRQDRLEQELFQCRAELGELAARRTTLQAERNSTLESLAALEGERARLGAEGAEAESLRERAQAALSELRLALATRQSSLEALEQLEREREGYGTGVRAVFTEEGSTTVRGVVGTVADLLDVPQELERAVEAVLGERLTWVVLEQFEDCKLALEFLKERGAGPATFLPLETLPSGNDLPEDQADVRWAARLVSSPYAALLHYLFGRVAVVPRLEQAETLWRRNGAAASYVTLAGEVLGAAGRLSGGGKARDDKQIETSLLGRKRALREARGERDRLSREVSLAQVRLEELGATLQRLRARQDTLSRTIQTEEALRLAREKDLEQAVRDHERLSQYLDTLMTEARQVEAEVEQARQSRVELEGEAEAARVVESSLEQASAGLRQTVDRLQADEGRLAEELTAGQVEWASLGERVEALKREQGHLAATREELTGLGGQAEARRRQITSRSAELTLERERVDQRAQEVAGERNRAEIAERSSAQYHEAVLAELQEIDKLVTESEQLLARTVSDLHAAELKATELRVRREELEQEAWRSFGVDRHTLSQRHEPQRDLNDARTRLADLEGKLATMGPLNLLADEEYRELEERLTFLRAQHDDLLGSMKDLERALRGMTRAAQERFQTAFEAINRHFGEIFTRLFEGGRAELRLVEPEEAGDPLEAGIDLMAQPRGKRLQSVTLLSGGEKALTGLALLFAIFYYRPSPFCVLDEVDAPLDDANIQRFHRVLREFVRQTQFIIITHNRKTMETADVLYGVTMEEPGLSRLVSVKLAE
ncbi:MAG: chromosome segregation protein SMC [Candidatus Methylomirabilia bacterium]